MIRVQTQDFDPGQELRQFGNGNTAIGGICLFLGLVRDFTGDDQPVHGLTLDHYPGMTERQLQAIEQQARDRWPLDDVLIIHRYGDLLPGDRIVLVATASAHRQAAFESCAFLMDWLKTKAPFWKLERHPDGDQWVSAKSSDDDAAQRWNQEPS